MVGCLLSEASLLNYYFIFPRQHTKDALNPCFLISASWMLTCIKTSSELHDMWDFLSVFGSSISFHGLPGGVDGKRESLPIYLCA